MKSLSDIELPGDPTTALEAATKQYTDGEVSAHAAAADPHPGYLTQAEGDGRYVESAGDTITGILGFGSVTRQMLNLYGTTHGLGVQPYTVYFRTGDDAARSGFRWYHGGVHSDTMDDPGLGGTTLLSLLPSGLTIHDGGVDAWLAQDRYDINTRGDDALIPDGMSLMYSSTGGWPTTYTGTFIRTYKSSQGAQATLQYAIDVGQDPPEIWVRRWRTGGGGLWSSWALLTVGPWQTPTLLNGWVDYGGTHATAQYRREAGNLVRVKGLVKGGTHRNVFALPSAYIPTETHIDNHSRASGQGELRVDTTGNVYSYSGYDATWMSLAMTFPL